MRIAVASEGLAVSPYFGHCASFTCYRIERGIIVECQNMPNPHQTPARINGMSYSVLMNGLKKAGVQLDRKVLSDMAINDPAAFTAITEVAKKAL